MRRGAYSAEAGLIAALHRYRTSGRFADLEEMVAAVEGMAAVFRAHASPPTIENYREEAECLEQAFRTRVSSRVPVLLRPCPRRLRRIIGRHPQRGSSRGRSRIRARAYPREVWRLTAGGWLETVRQPDVDGHLFLGDLQQRFHAEQLTWKQEIDSRERARREEELAKHQEEAERAQAIESEEERRRREKADADAAARRAEEREAHCGGSA